jgi:hypothetical protein
VNRTAGEPGAAIALALPLVTFAALARRCPSSPRGAVTPLLALTAVAVLHAAPGPLQPLLRAATTPRRRNDRGSTP